MDAMYLDHNRRPVPEPADHAQQREVTTCFNEFLRALALCPSTREISLAKTNAEQAMMWAGRHFFVQQEKN